MADDVKSLAKFTPAAVKRDALLVAAGRASVPSRRPWQAATALLCLTQAVTLAVWLRPLGPDTLPPTPEPPAVAPPPAEWQPPPPSSYLALRAHIGDLPPPPPPSSAIELPASREPFGVRSTLD